MSLLQCAELLVAICFLAMVILILLKLQRGEGPLPYFSKEFLLTRGESIFYQTLRRSMPAHLVICPKVRMADVLGCSAEAWKAGFGGRISQKHVDFILADIDTTAIALAIELDDRTHSQKDRQTRDLFVDRAFAAAGIPILHIPAAAAYDAKALRDQIAAAVKDTSAMAA